MLSTETFGDEAAAHTFTYPHGSVSGSSQFCTVCHTMHDSPSSNLLKNATESALCFTCHNGTGSVYNIQVEMNLDPGTNAMHPINVSLNYNQGVYTYSPSTTAGIAPPGPYVSPSPAQGSGPAYVDNGEHSGSCTLSCHGVDHAPASY